MEHITYEDYTKFGGKADIDAFPNLLIDTEAMLEKVTFNRIDKLDDNIKRLIVQCMDNVLQNTHRGISSYSNGIESITYQGQDTESAIRDLCRQYLPNELLYRGRRWRA